MHDGDILKFNRTDIKVAACIYIVCRLEKVIITYEKISNVSNNNKRLISRTIKAILTALGLVLDYITAGEFAESFCSALGLPQIVQDAAICIANTAVDLGITHCSIE